MTARRDDLDPDYLVALHGQGMSQRAIAERIGASQATVRRILHEQGSARDMAAAGRRRWEDRRDEAMQAIAKTAAANRKPISQSALEGRAKGRQRSGKVQVSPHENVLAEHLRRLGAKPVAQYAVERYNIDLAFPDVMLAVEVHNFAHHPNARARWVRRSEDLRDRGWLVLYVWLHDSGPAEIGAAERVVAEAERLRLDPAAPRQQQVIRRNGEDAVRLGGIARPTGRYPKQR